MGIHDIDGLIWLSGSRPKSVYAAQQKSLYRPRADRPRHGSDCTDAECPYRCAPSASVPAVKVPIGGLNLAPAMTADPKAYDLDLCCYNSGHELYDRGVFAIEMENGVLATFEFNIGCAAFSREYEIMGSKGMIWGNLPANQFTFQANFTKEPQRFDVRHQALPDMPGDPVFGDAALFDDLAAMLRTGKRPRAEVRHVVLACLTVFAGEKATVEGVRIPMREFIAPDLHASLLGE